MTNQTIEVGARKPTSLPEVRLPIASIKRRVFGPSVNMKSLGTSISAMFFMVAVAGPFSQLREESLNSSSWAAPSLDAHSRSAAKQIAATALARVLQGFIIDICKLSQCAATPMSTRLVPKVSCLLAEGYH